MQTRKLYRKRPKYHVTAVQLDLEFDGFSYDKWDHEQTCKARDWLVNNNGDVYTVDKEFFRDNYQIVSPGVYEKIGEVWAEIAHERGSIDTKEGSTAYEAGDYLVFDRKENGDGYAVKKNKFERMYEEIDKERELTPEQQSYIEERISPKIKKYTDKATKNRKKYHTWQMLAIISAALVPVLSALSGVAFKWLIAALGGASAVIAGLLSLYKYQENWSRYRNAFQDLDSHISQFKVCASIYQDRRNAFNLLVENCESILNSIRGQWTEKGAADGKQINDD